MYIEKKLRVVIYGVVLYSSNLSTVDMMVCTLTMEKKLKIITYGVAVMGKSQIKSPVISFDEKI